MPSTKQIENSPSERLVLIYGRRESFSRGGDSLGWDP